MLSILNTSSSDEKMGTAYLVSSFDHAFSIKGMMIILSELLVCEVGCDIVKGICFFHNFAELL